MSTKRVFLKLGIGSFSLACALLLLMHAAVSRTQAAKGFDKESITGAYAYAADGFLESNPNPNPDFGPVASDYAPVAVAGFITFDGKGQFHIVDSRGQCMAKSHIPISGLIRTCRQLTRRDDSEREPLTQGNC